MAMKYFDFVLSFFIQVTLYTSNILVELSIKSRLQHRSADLQRS